MVDFIGKDEELEDEELEDEELEDEEIDWDDLYPAEGLDADELD